MLDKTPKSILNELLQLNMCSLKPKFATNRVGGDPHAPLHRATLTVPSWHIGVERLIAAVEAEGTGRSKRAAEHHAAAEALKRLRGVEGLRWPALKLDPAKRPLPVFDPDAHEEEAAQGGVSEGQL